MPTVTKHRRLTKPDPTEASKTIVYNSDLDKVESGFTVQGTAGESISQYQGVFYNAGTNRWMRALDASVGVRGIAATAAANGQTIYVYQEPLSIITNVAWAWSVGLDVYNHGSTAGTLTTTPPTTSSRPIGVAISATEIMLHDPGPTPLHNLLSTGHGDTTAAAVVAGDIVVGDATPRWARLARGTAGFVLKAGATVLAWGQVAFSELTGTLGAGQHGTLSDGDHTGALSGYGTPFQWGTRSGSLSTTATEFFSPMGTHLLSATESVTQIVIIGAADVRKWRIDLTAAPGAGTSRTFTLRKNGVSTSAVITISDTDTVGSWSGTVSFAENDLVAIMSTLSGTPAAAVVRSGIRLRETAA